MYAEHFLAELEGLFGPRDRSFTLLGIDICETPNNHPHLWFPSTGVAPDDVTRRSSHIVIHLGPDALTDPARARWQLAHECVHLLDPWNERVDGEPTNCLEEGLASWYQNTRVPEAESHESLYGPAEDLNQSQGEIRIWQRSIGGTRPSYKYESKVFTESARLIFITP